VKGLEQKAEFEAFGLFCCLYCSRCTPLQSVDPIPGLQILT